METGLKVGAEWVGIAALILTGIQGLKKLPFIGVLLDKWLGMWWGLALALLAAGIQAFILYSGDGNLTGDEALQILVTMAGAIGGHTLLKAAEKKVVR